MPRRVTGTTVLSLAESGDVTWSEAGSMTWGDHEVEVARTLHVVRRGDGWWVVFADGRDFHPWAPGRAVDHPCGADHYRGLVEAEPAAPQEPVTRWRVRWDVRGLQKDYTMTSELTRPG